MAWPKGTAANLEKKRNITPFHGQKRRLVGFNMTPEVFAQIKAACTVLGVTQQSFFTLATISLLAHVHPVLAVHDKQVARELLKLWFEDEMKKPVR